MLQLGKQANARKGGPMPILDHTETVVESWQCDVCHSTVQIQGKTHIEMIKASERAGWRKIGDKLICGFCIQTFEAVLHILDPKLHPDMLEQYLQGGKQ